MTAIEADGATYAVDDPGEGLPSEINAWKTAITRRALSRPTRIAYEDGLINPRWTMLDYGAGRGFDAGELAKQGIQATSWDPHYSPDNPKTPVDVVNVGFVLNVIPEPEERKRVLKEAFALSDHALVIGVRTENQRPKLKSETDYGDGVVTGSGTFQKFFTREEFQRLVEDTLGLKAHIRDDGIAYVFKDQGTEMAWQADVLRDGALPPETERSKVDALVGAAATQLIGKEAAEAQGLYDRGTADPKAVARLIDALDDPAAMKAAFKDSAVGKRVFKSLYVHDTAIGDMPALMRLKVAQAKTVAPDAPADLVKIDTAKNAVSLLQYPNFEDDPHPALKGSVRVNLETMEAKPQNYANSPNPWILHRKETFVSVRHPRHDDFAALTAKEEEAGLLSRPDIGSRNGWQTALSEKGLAIKGYDLVDVTRVTGPDREPKERIKAKVA